MPNYKNLRAGDIALIRDHTGLLGIARIVWIESEPGTKEQLRCPECRTTSLKERKLKRPVYRCNVGHETDFPLREDVACTTYKAHFGDSFAPARDVVSLRALQAASPNRSDQFAMRPIDIRQILPQLLESSSKAKLLLTTGHLPYDGEEPDGQSRNLDTRGTNEVDYQPGYEDTRDRVMRQIRARRGQRKFRDSLLSRYGGAYMISGCRLTEILEAAHISPYRGINDNHVGNGLLLRADLHTLFDLDLIGVEPDSLTIHVHPHAARAGYGVFEGKALRCGAGMEPDRGVLESRWARFRDRSNWEDQSVASDAT